MEDEQRIKALEEKIRELQQSLNHAHCTIGVLQLQVNQKTPAQLARERLNAPYVYARRWNDARR